MLAILSTLLSLTTTSSPAENIQVKNSNAMLHYLVREPKIKTAKPPVIILLHGVGSNEQDLFSFAERIPGNFLVVSARAPYTIGKDSYAWYEVDFSTGTPLINKEHAEKSRNTIIQFIGQLKIEHAFDDKEVYLCGFSQGAIMAYSVGLTQPGLIKGIAVMSGRLLEEVKPLIDTSGKLQQLRVFISHGTDDSVLKIQYAREALTYLKKLGVQVTYKEYREGHAISNEMLGNFINWLGGK